jgi:hypothetical protein
MSETSEREFDAGTPARRLADALDAMVKSDAAREEIMRTNERSFEPLVRSRVAVAHSRELLRRTVGQVR